MPQFDFANVFIPQLFWLAVFFAVLYFGIVKTTLPRLGKVMAQREDKISGDLAAAKTARDDAGTIDEDYRTTLEASREEARASVAAAKLDAARSNEARLAETDAAMGAELEQAERRIAEAREAARGSVRDIAVDSAQAIVAKLTGSEPERAAAEARVEAALSGAR